MLTFAWSTSNITVWSSCHPDMNIMSCSGKRAFMTFPFRPPLPDVGGYSHKSWLGVYGPLPKPLPYLWPTSAICATLHREKGNFPPSTVVSFALHHNLIERMRHYLKRSSIEQQKELCTFFLTRILYFLLNWLACKVEFILMPTKTLAVVSLHSTSERKQ